MVSDIRIELSFRNHRKLKRLMRLIGTSAGYNLISLWSAAAETRPTGVLTGCDAVDIAEMANWSDEPDRLLDALIKCRWIDTQDGTYALHDWEEHQPWVVGSPRRSEIARQNALARWYPGQVDTTGMPSACGSHAKSNAPSPLRIPSVSSPYPRSSKELLSMYTAEFSLKYPQLDLEHETEKCWTYWEPKDKGSKRKPNWKLRLMNWLDNAKGAKGNGRDRQGTGIPGNRPTGAFSDLER